ncbi:MAG: glycosyl transferase [Deltaproteobacteria bacterium RIFOXYC2_FULL_48_10]|nr:MAG: glycosyl transferase [Deltaproteobacteria bacterium RIFOXYC2_FULL_48_10]
MKTVCNDQSEIVALSIVTTMYRSATFIDEFYRRSSEAAANVGLSYEIILVNDGSPDDAIDRARALVEADAHVRVIDLARNFGQHRAIMVGLEHARGCKVFLIDCDLEEDPLALTEFFTEMGRTKAEVVYGVENDRDGGIVRRFGGACFWLFFNLVSEIPVTPNIITSRLMTRRYVDALLDFRERELFIDGVFALAGFTQIPMKVEKHARSDSSYTLRKRLSVLVNAITSFSSKPLIFVFYLGLLISLCSGTALAVLIARVLLFGDYLIGWASLIVSIWLLGGITIFCLGLIGIYLAKVFQEVKNRPLSIVRDIYERAADDKLHLEAELRSTTK